ncbi:KxYKxGKxW signal peptide domain-containing protein [Lacticaseibacillus brantae]|uniref:Gram-positive cocci surface proteins LPxTG domain-containing protein n=1 Tax=Lacticaseibacillus brantae DSM 23927 TaxID=1423727 RepID=A0A0R2AYZ9_9LACO|nr:KxYKxGKxW signal peptide domain-containing protein [Lacticaseibacillus brantae]KRM71989.1 hypothetical protein FC34_GL000971 [Lacticaseibacillus brantae DSM 23927]
MNQFNGKTHYKMYKSGKFWLFSLTLIASFAAVSLENPVSAAEQPAQPAMSQEAVSPTAKASESPANTADTPTATTQPVVAAKTDQPATKAQTPAPQARVAAAPVAAVTPTPQADDTIDTWMPNKKLQTLVLLMLQKQGTGKTWDTVSDITKQDMQQLTSIDNYYDTSNKPGYDTFVDGITPYSLKGLEAATNLKNLILRMDYLHDPYTYRGDITDLSPIANLTKLQRIELTGNRIADLTPLKNLKQVTYLDLSWNCISDWTQLNPSQYTGTSAYALNPVNGASAGQIDPVKGTDGALFQLIKLAPQYIMSNQATLASPVILPDGSHNPLTGLRPQDTLTEIRQGMVADTATIIKSFEEFLNAGSSVQASDGTSLNYTITQLNQVPYGYMQTHPFPLADYPDAKYIPNDYLYYMLGFAYVKGSSDQKLLAQVVQPYVGGHVPTISGSDVTRYVGDPLPSIGDFNPQATDITGQQETSGTVSLQGVDMTKPGNYSVVISVPQSDMHPINLTKTVTLRVLANQQSLTAEDGTMYIGDSEPTVASFKASATDKTGQFAPVALNLNHANLSQAGNYDVILTAGTQSKTVILHVLANQKHISGSDFTMPAGSKEPTVSDFKGQATDKAGHALMVTLDLGNANLQEPGNYPVTLTASDGQRMTVTLHVTAAGSRNDATSGTAETPDPNSQPTTPVDNGQTAVTPSQLSTPSLPVSGTSSNPQPVVAPASKPETQIKPVRVTKRGQAQARVATAKLAAPVTRSIKTTTVSQSQGLPQTSDRKQSGLAIVGMLASALGAFGLWFTFKKH